MKDIKDASAEQFSSYLEKSVSDETKALLKEFSFNHPEIKDQLFNKAKNHMMATIYNSDQTRDYINGVIDTLKFISKYY